jgi:hypothetical protein
MWTIKHFTLAGVLAVFSAGVFSACSQQQLASYVTGKATVRPSYWVIEADTSGSTAAQARRGGAYEQEIMGALGQAARKQATVYGGAIDGNAIGDASWQIDGVSPGSSAGGGNARLAEAARVRSAGELRGTARQLLATHPTNGSDILGALQRVAQLGHSLPKGTPKTLVLLSDGALNLSRFGGYDIYTNPPYTPATRGRLITRFKREGELPDLSGWKVYLGGIGVGIGDRATARAVLELWEALIPASGAKLVQINSTLAFG